MSLLPDCCMPENNTAFHFSQCRYPHTDVFESIADEADFDVLKEILAIGLNDQHDDPILNSLETFGRVNRFSDGTFSLFSFYTTIELAVVESKKKLTAFLQATNEIDTEISLQLYLSKILLPLHDLRDEKYHSLLSSADFKVTHKFVGVLRQQSSLGLLYKNSENDLSERGVIFKKEALSKVKAKHHYRFYWQQKVQKISHVFSIKEEKS